MKLWGAWESQFNSYLLKLSIFNDLYIQDWPKVISIYYGKNSYHLGKDIDVVGNKESRSTTWRKAKGW
jgi:RIO-like serine/threonine protein kinase